MRVEVLGKQLFTIHAADGGAATIYFNLRDLIRREKAVQRKDVADLRVAGVVAADARRVGDHRHHARQRLFRRGGQLDVVVERLGHLVHAIGAHHAAERSVNGLRLDQHLPKVMIERAYQLAGELDVRGLVFAHRHVRGFVKRNVGGHQHRVAEQTVIHIVRLLADFILERRQVCQLAERRDHRKRQVQLGHFWHVALDKDDGAARRVHPSRQPVQHHLGGPLAQVLGVAQRGERVPVHHAIDAFVIVLQRDIVLNRAEIVAQVLPPRRARAGKDSTFHGDSPKNAW